jgi:YHS domain-containing protein
MTRDPVCRMSVEEAKAAATSVSHHVCSAGCTATFEKALTSYATL